MATIQTTHPLTAATPPEIAGPADEFHLRLRRNWRLRVPETVLTLMAAAAGIPAGLGVALLAHRLAPPQSMLGRMFDLRDAAAAIPVLIACFFCWGGAVCAVRWLRLGALARGSAPGLVQQISHVLTAVGPRALIGQLHTPAAATSPLLRRVRAVVQLWLIRPGIQEANVVLQQHVIDDEDALRRGYNLVRTFVWALPVLGLMGTVIGIAVAVGGFAEFLGGDVDDVGAIKQSLVGVTSGLSFAFLITLEGLAGSLVLMLAVSGLQGREERLLARVQQGIVDHVLPRLEVACPSSGGRRDDEAATAWGEALERAAEGTFARLRAESERAAEGLGLVTVQIGSEMRRAGEAFVERVATVERAISEQSRALETALDRPVQALVAYQGEVVGAIDQQARALRLATDALSALTEVTREVLQVQAKVQTTLRELDGSDLDRTLSGLRGSLDDLRPVLGRLSQPFVLQAVPVNGDRA